MYDDVYGIRSVSPRLYKSIYLYQGILYKIPCKCKCKYKYVKQYTSARLQFILEKKNPIKSYLNERKRTILCAPAAVTRAYTIIIIIYESIPCFQKKLKR